MTNEINKFIDRYKKQIGITALALFVLGVFVKNTGIDIPIFSGSILGSFTSFGFNVGILLAIIGVVLMSIGIGSPFGLIFFAGGILLAGGNAVSGFIQLINLLSKPIVAVVLGLIFAFLIFRKRK